MGSLPQPHDDLLTTLTLEEKISLLAGQNFWETVPIPRAGVPSLKVSDGPNGARGATFSNGTTAACFPASVLLAASWDLTLVRRIGNALAEETKTKGARVILGPTVCPHRHVLGGRNFESFSEDPLLAGVMAASYVKGVQEKGVGATVKHFAVNEQETKRFTMNANVSDRALREIYLKPFEIAVKEAQPWAIMSSYNLVNGTHADMNEYLLKTVLRENWGFDGLVMSDWGGVNSTVESLKAGLDLEMPGPTIRRKIEDVKAAINAGKLSVDVIDQRVSAVLTLLQRTGRFENPEVEEEQAIDRPEHRAAIREAGGKGITLLKNEDNILPLKSGHLGKVAVLGLSKTALAHGGGSASVNAHYKITPWEALQSAIGDRAELLYAEGARVDRCFPHLSSGLTTEKGEPGLTVSQWKPDTPRSAAPDATITTPVIAYTPLETKLSFVTLTGFYTPEHSGKHHLQLGSLGPTKLFIEGELVHEITEDCDDAMGMLLGGLAGKTVEYDFIAGKKYAIRIESAAPKPESADFVIMESLLSVTLGVMTDATLKEDVLS